MITAWIFVAALTLASGQPATYTSDRHATEDACDTARAQWLREQVSARIEDLGQCQPAGAQVVRRGK